MSNNSEKHLTGIESHYIMKNNRKMRFGYTTGTCAAAAAKAAAQMLFSGAAAEYVKVTTPKGIPLELEVEDIDISQDYAGCGIVKDAGDDPDVTDGLMIKVKVEKTSDGITIEGGEGVGRVTKPGLEQPVGEAAINSVPRKTIMEAVDEIMEQAGYDGGLKITISVPGGAETALKTFNPRLGIEGGISIIGTSGIVEPMSETAVIDSMALEMKQQTALGRKDLIVTLGNYGREYLEELDALPMKENVKCSNFVGEAIDAAVDAGAESVLFIAHIGKFVKVAGGIMNTHSRNADARAEIMAAAAMKAGVSRGSILKILDTVTTDDAIDVIISEDKLNDTMKEICGKIAFYMDKRCRGIIRTEALIFSNAHGFLGETDGCRELIKKLGKEERTDE